MISTSRNAAPQLPLLARLEPHNNNACDSEAEERTQQKQPHAQIASTVRHNGMQTAGEPNGSSRPLVGLALSCCSAVSAVPGAAAFQLALAAPCPTDPRLCWTDN